MRPFVLPFTAQPSARLEHDEAFLTDPPFFIPGRAVLTFSLPGKIPGLPPPPRVGVGVGAGLGAGPLGFIPTPPRVGIGVGTGPPIGAGFGASPLGFIPLPPRVGIGVGAGFGAGPLGTGVPAVPTRVGIGLVMPGLLGFTPPRVGLVMPGLVGLLLIIYSLNHSSFSFTSNSTTITLNRATFFKSHRFLSHTLLVSSCSHTIKLFFFLFRCWS